MLCFQYSNSYENQKFFILCKITFKRKFFLSYGVHKIIGHTCIHIFTYMHLFGVCFSGLVENGGTPSEHSNYRDNSYETILNGTSGSATRPYGLHPQDSASLSHSQVLASVETTSSQSALISDKL